MSRNIGWTKKQAEAIARKYRQTHLAHDAYAQREDNWPRNPKTSIVGECQFTHQWIVVLQKKSNPKESVRQRLLAGLMIPAENKIGSQCNGRWTLLNEDCPSTADVIPQELFDSALPINLSGGE